MKNICILIFIIYCLLISCNKKRPVEIDNQEVISESNFEEFIKAGDSLALNELETQKNLLDFEKDIYPYIYEYLQFQE